MKKSKEKKKHEKKYLQIEERRKLKRKD